MKRKLLTSSLYDEKALPADRQGFRDGGNYILFFLIGYGFLFSSLIFTQTKYPADSVLVSSNSTLIEKALILPIAGWQRFSHNTRLLDCQFYPSCSQYGAIAIKENGILKGIPMTADRIVRCNPSAFFNQLHLRGGFHEQDGRLIDHPTSHLNISTKKSPVVAGLMSAILPGSGRMYVGRWFDGFMGFLMVYITASSALDASKSEHNFQKSFSYSMAGVFYVGEIYGAYRTAKYYQRQ
jgi:putative component of membrane protein insertase Oxa1/YidC/SpoIIIJ protein YidD